MRKLAPFLALVVVGCGQGPVAQAPVDNAELSQSRALDLDGDGIPECIDLDDDGACTPDDLDLDDLTNMSCTFAVEDTDGDLCVDTFTVDCGDLLQLDLVTGIACPSCVPVGVDDDGDGIPECVDLDCDGLGDVCIDDLHGIGGNGGCTHIPLPEDSDGDGCADSIDLDCDGTVDLDLGDALAPLCGLEESIGDVVEEVVEEVEEIANDLGICIPTLLDSDGDGRFDCIDMDCDDVGDTCWSS